jgi:hypothetical protein
MTTVHRAGSALICRSRIRPAGAPLIVLAIVSVL